MKEMQETGSSSQSLQYQSLTTRFLAHSMLCDCPLVGLEHVMMIPLKNTRVLARRHGCDSATCSQLIQLIQLILLRLRSGYRAPRFRTAQALP